MRAGHPLIPSRKYIDFDGAGKTSLCPTCDAQETVILFIFPYKLDG